MKDNVQKSPKNEMPKSPFAYIVQGAAFVGIGLLRIMSIPVGLVLWVADRIPWKRPRRPHETLQQTDQYHRHVRRPVSDDIPLGHVALIFIVAVLVVIWVLF